MILNNTCKAIYNAINEKKQIEIILTDLSGQKKREKRPIELKYFYEDDTKDDAFDLIEDDIADEFGNIEHYSVSLLDIITVANAILENQFNELGYDIILSVDDIRDLVLHINNEFKEKYLADEVFVQELDNLMRNIKVYIEEYSYKIKKYKSNEEDLVRKNLAIEKVKEAKSKINELYVERKYLKISLTEMEKTRRNLLLAKSNGTRLIMKNNGVIIKKININDDVKLSRKRQKLEELAKLIENDSISAKEIASYIFNLVSRDDIKDIRIRNQIKDIVLKLKSKLKNIGDDIKDLREDVIYFDQLAKEIEILDYISEEEYLEIKEIKKELKTSYSILNDIKNDSNFSTKVFKAALKANRKSLIKSNGLSSKSIVMKKIDGDGYYDADIKGVDLRKGLGSYSDYQTNLLLYEIRHIFDKYEADNYSMAFYIKNEYNKVSSKKYAFSLNEQENNIIVKMHVINIAPYVSYKLKDFWYTEFFKKLHLDYEHDKATLNEVASGLRFKTDGVVPTIAYTFKFDKKYNLEEFEINQDNVMLREIEKHELEVLNDICNYNNDKSYRNNIFFEKLLQTEFIKFVKSRDLPIIFFGKYNDESYGKYRQAKKIGCEKMGNSIAALADVLYDVDGKTFDSVCWRWYKNYKIKHFSLDYQEDCIYLLEDLGILDPASFMGINTQHILNKKLFLYDNNNKKNEMINEKIKNNQKDFIHTFNSAVGYIEIEDFIKMISDIIGNRHNQKKF